MILFKNFFKILFLLFFLGSIFGSGFFYGSKLQKNGKLGEYKKRISPYFKKTDLLPNDNSTEYNLLQTLKALEPPIQNDFNPHFNSLLAEGLGVDNLKPSLTEGGPTLGLQSSTPAKNGRGTWQEIRINYTSPKITTRALWWKQPKEKAADTLLVLLHGHTKSLNEFTKTSPGDDYIELGYDVLGFDLTTDRDVSSLIHAELTGWGLHLNGIWVRSVCDTLIQLKVRKNYKRVIIHGFSNGGIIADQISVLCEPVTLIIVDDILDERSIVNWGNIDAARFEPYYFYFLSPLVFQSSLLDYFSNSKSPKLYTRNKDLLFNELQFIEKIKGHFKITSDLNVQTKIKILFHNYKEHEPTPRIELRQFFDKEFKSLSGVSVLPK